MAGYLRSKLVITLVANSALWISLVTALAVLGRR
jgi:hypothetical protein